MIDVQKWLGTIHSKGVQQSKERPAWKKQTLREIFTSPKAWVVLIVHCSVKNFVAMLLLWKLVIYLYTRLFYEKIECGLQKYNKKNTNK